MNDAATSQITGGCHCGEIRYEARGPIDHLTHCHCTICRAFGGTLMSWITVDQSRFRISSGTPKLYFSSPNGQREFCEDCGAHLTFRRRDVRKTIDIAIGTLDKPGNFPPDNQIWGHERLPFLSDMNCLPLSMDGGVSGQDASSVTPTEHVVASSRPGQIQTTHHSGVEIRDSRDIACDEIVRLYQANGWSAANKPEQLYRGLMNSSALVTARIEDRLVGLTNAITDGHLVVYYPHMLVDPDYQGSGIGQLMMQSLQARYSHMHQQVLIAYGSAVDFYSRCGFRQAGDNVPMRICDADDA